MEYIIMIALTIIAYTAAAFYIISKTRKHNKITNGISNTNLIASEYLFKVNLAKEEFLHKLRFPNAGDVLGYVFDESTMTVVFTWYNEKLPYSVRMKETDGGCYVKLYRDACIGTRLVRYYKINEFMVGKFAAEPLPYKEYKNLFE